LALAASVGVVTFVTFARALKNGFVNWDDPRAIVDNPYLTELTGENLRWMFTTFHMGPYQPLSWLSLALDHALWGGFDPFGFHLTSILLHTVTAGLFCLLALRLFSLGVNSTDASQIAVAVAAAAAALLWSVHPLRVESVAWATERRDVLSGLLVAATLLVWLEAVAPRAETAPRTIRRRTYCAVILAAAAILAKATAVTIPLLLLLLDWYPLRRTARTTGTGAAPAPVWPLVLEKVPFFVLSGLGGVVAVIGQRSAGTMYAAEAIDWTQRLLIMVRAVAFYPIKTFWPTGLAPIYELPHGGLTVDFAFVTSALFLVAVSAAALMAARRLPAVAVAWAAYLVMVLPVSGLLQSGPQWAADRYTYLSCAPLAVLAAAVLTTDRARRAGRAVAAAAGVVVLVLALLTQQQIGIWRDSISLWTATIERRPEASIAYSNRGQLWVERGDWARAEADLTHAVRLFPTYSDALHNLAWVHGRRGNWPASEEMARRALGVTPDSVQAWLHLGEALARQGRIGEAAAAHERALELDPDNTRAWLRLGSLFQALGRLDAMIEAAERAVALSPDLVLGHLFHASALQAAGREDEALAAVRRAIVIDPSAIEPRLVECEILLAQGRIEAARAGLEAVIRRDPSNQRARDLLASFD
jgi:tetratricopeptide (TPR) repeat protein